jgi:hypothetical protein
MGEKEERTIEKVEQTNRYRNNKIAKLICELI